MLIVGENLRSLIPQHKIIDDPASYDINSLTLHLHDSIKEFQVASQAIVTYGEELKPEWMIEDHYWT